MNFTTFFTSILLSLIFLSCSNTSEKVIDKESPEGITEAFAVALADGNCDVALSITANDANNMIKSLAEQGCEGYKRETGVSCDSIVDNKTTCTCIERQNDGAASVLTYDLEKIDGKWKVVSFEKDMSETIKDINNSFDEALNDIELSGETVVPNTSTSNPK